MPKVTWPLYNGRPRIEIALTQLLGDSPIRRNLLADTGAGSEQAGFELVLDQNDCLMCGGLPMKQLQLRGAVSGLFPVYAVRVQVPQLGFDEDVEVVGVPSLSAGINGIAGFRFLNRFGYGNFGNRGEFGIELERTTLAFPLLLAARSN